jgi:hypothetical protein
MSKTEEIHLNLQEVNYLKSLVEDNIESGIYWGNKLHFDKMQSQVLDKLEEASSVLI